MRKLLLGMLMSAGLILVIITTSYCIYHFFGAYGLFLVIVGYGLIFVFFVMSWLIGDVFFDDRESGK